MMPEGFLFERRADAMHWKTHIQPQREAPNFELESMAVSRRNSAVLAQTHAAETGAAQTVLPAPNVKGEQARLDRPSHRGSLQIPPLAVETALASAHVAARLPGCPRWRRTFRCGHISLHSFGR